MSATLKASADGTQAIIQVGGVDKLVIGASGIEPSSFKNQSVSPSILSQPFSEAVALGTVGVGTLDFTSIPSWVKRITITLHAMSTNGTSLPTIRLGTSGGVQASGYAGTVTVAGAGSNSGAFSTGFDLNTATSMAAARVVSGVLTLTRISQTWIISGVLGASDTTLTMMLGGSVTVSGTLDRLRLTTVNGTDQFDNGAVTIYFE